MPKHTLKTVLLASALTAYGQGAHAQTTANDIDAAGLDEIIVTAQKRAESLQSVPIAVTALDATELFERDYTNAADLSQAVPGLTIKSGFSASNPTIFLRGVGINDFAPTNSGAVGVTVDEVFYNSTTGQLFQLFDLERVEVLKGPQGTLYGRNTTAGVLNFHTIKPVIGEESGYAKLELGNYSAVNLEGAANVPLTESLALRVSAVTNNRDGTRDITLPNGNVVDKNDVDFKAIRAQLLFEPTDTLSILAKYESARSSGTMVSYEAQGLINPLTGEVGDEDFDRVCGGRGAGICTDALGYIDDPDPFSGSENIANTPEEVGADTLTLKVEADLGSFDFTSITSYLETDRFLLQEIDASPNRLAEEATTTQGEQFSQEIRFTSNWDAPYNVIFGGFYLQDEISSQDFFEILGALNPTPGEPFFDGDNAILRVDRLYTQETETAAAFLQGEYELSDQLTLTAGLRYTWENRTLEHGSFVGPVDAVPLTEQAPVFAQVVSIDDFGDDDITFKEPTWKVVLDYKPTSDALLYASIAKGFKSGGFSTGALLGPDEASITEPENLLAYEVGFKTQWLDNRLRLNGAGFFYDYEDLQVFGLGQDQVVPTFILFNAQQAEVLGGEIEVTAAPTDGLTLGGALTYLDGEYTEYVSPGGTDFSGNRLIASPEFSGTAYIRYEQPISNGLRGVILADTSYTGKQFFDSANAERLSSDEYWLVNGRIALQSENGGWELAAFAKNLLDEAYVSDSFDVAAFGFDEFVYGTPRTYGASLTLRFGQ